MKNTSRIIAALVLSLISFSTAFTAQAEESTPQQGISPAMVNINTADEQELADELNGIGLKKAQMIVQYRKEIGGFTSIDQLEDVKGIGPKFIEANRAIISIETAP